MGRQLHERVLERLGLAIAAGELPAGHTTSIDELTAQDGVSRSVVREAVRVLQSAGMLRSTQRVGIVVRPQHEWNLLDPLVIRWRLAAPQPDAQLRSLTELRQAVEPHAAELAATHAPEGIGAELVALSQRMREHGAAGDVEAFLDLDIQFHAGILRASGNELYAQLTDHIAAVLAARTHHGLMPAHPHSDTLQLHEDVATAIAASDPDAAYAAMDRIMRRTTRELTPIWQDAPRPS